MSRTGISLAVAVLVAAALTPATTALSRTARGAVACPLVFGHGGYPKDPGATTKDQIRQANNPRAVNDMRAWGADGVEADVQLTRNGTKAVMWHNITTNGLTGGNRKITDLWWTAGADNLSARRISRGPYSGERVHTLREWLDHVRFTGLIALLEIKPQARAALSSAAHGAAAWREISAPILERQASQRIMVYSTDAWIQGELDRRHPALLKGPAARWADSAAWDEPAPDWSLNVARWQSVLGQAPPSVMTNYTADYRRWLSGRCT
ncbi:glycerophosphodiester phosphodiesterase [Nonomuraea sp. LPB2021202275-12-8]|uniref:glycerophosphodiester phosphodiesterase n=1 Tax=Nonomuraea sp. LPB2021202275-12-8 TaxID=3120159 RepID=UPI00300CAA6F